MQILLSNNQAGPGRTVKQEQEEISRNHVQAFIPGPVLIMVHHRLHSKRSISTFFRLVHIFWVLKNQSLSTILDCLVHFSG